MLIVKMKKMKKFLIIILIFISNEIIAQNPEGTWYWKSENGNHEVELFIKIFNNEEIKGSYCSVFYQGDKIDCNNDIESDFNFQLNCISRNTYQGTFTSNFSFTSGIVKLVYDPLNQKMSLTIINKPEGEYYLPTDAVFSK